MTFWAMTQFTIIRMEEMSMCSQIMILDVRDQQLAKVFFKCHVLTSKVTELEWKKKEIGKIHKYFT